MQMNQRYAWGAFGLAFLCVASALAFFWISGRKSRAPQPMPPSFAEPEYIPASIPEPVVMPKPAITKKPATLPPATPVQTKELVQVYPGGWVWNPYWHRWDARYNRWDPYWRVPRDPYWYDRRDRHPWDRKHRREDRRDSRDD
jgi:hypothetical protein